jgi:hypothetical protein
MNLAQRLDELAQRKAEEEAAAEQDEDGVENGYEDDIVESRQSVEHGSHGRTRSIGRGNEMKNTRGNMETQDDEEEEDMEEGQQEYVEDDAEGNTCWFSLIPLIYYCTSQCL